MLWIGKMDPLLVYLPGVALRHFYNICDVQYMCNLYNYLKVYVIVIYNVHSTLDILS